MSDVTVNNPSDLKRRLREANEQERAALVEALPYQVGFGKPPKPTRFQLGQSGNRKGRPKGAFNFATILEQELAQKVEVSEHGQRRKMSKAQVGIRQLLNKAASGDPKALTALIDLLRKTGKINEAAVPAALAVDQRDLQAVGGVLEFFQTSSQETAGPAEGQK